MGDWFDAIICYDTTVNAETVDLPASAGTSKTIRDSSFGQAYLTHALVQSSTDDVNHAWVVPSGYPDTNGFELPMISRYAATASFDYKYLKLPKPIPLAPNSTLVVNAQSETAANSVVVAWLGITYKGGQLGRYEMPSTGGKYTQRDLDAGAALTSVVVADGTAITDLLAGMQYQVVGISGVGVDGQTAGVVGPAFVKFSGPAEFAGANCYVPLANSTNYVATGKSGWSDFAQAEIPMPKFNAPCRLTPTFWGYTAERPQGRLILAANY